MRKTDILNTDLVQVAYFDYDFSSIFEGGAAPDYRKLKVANQIEVSFQHDKLQKDTIDGYTHRYGATLAGLGSLLMKVPVHRIMRVGYVGSREIGDSFVTNASNDRIDQTLEV